MRCDYCPLSAPEDVCPEAEGKYGIEHKDGMLGCSHPWNWVKKRDNDYNEYLGNKIHSNMTSKLRSNFFRS